MRKVRMGLLAVMILVLILPAGVLAAQMPELDSEVEQAIKEAYTASDDCSPEELSLRYFGQYDGCHIAFVDGPFDFPCVEWSEVVVGYEFSYSSGQRLWVFRDGEIESLTSAYEAGWLSDEAVGIFWDYYNNVYGNPNTGDGILGVVLAMTLCGAAAIIPGGKRK